ncbi:hypothetical protein [Jannaschia donghaensis]|nr:hypothetical protein [Jannaschia donghaensis]
MPIPEPEDGRFDDGYNAGWDDAMAQVDEEQTRVGAQLADRLIQLSGEHCDLQGALIADLEPALRDIFDKILPHAVERSFHATLVEEITSALESANGQLRILVSPEDVSALSRLLTHAGIPPDQAIVAAEPALAMSQALIRWTGQERRIDLDGVLSDMDAALDTYFATLNRGQNAADVKEA